jgi:hypothetical protein
MSIEHIITAPLANSHWQPPTNNQNIHRALLLKSDEKDIPGKRPPYPQFPEKQMRQVFVVEAAMEVIDRFYAELECF